MKEITKPFTMQLDEFDSKIIEVINSSGIHPSIALMRMENIIGSLRQEVEYLKQQEANQYNQQLNAEKMDTEKEEIPDVLND